MEAQQWRAGMYQLLAGLLAEPDAEFVEAYPAWKIFYQEVCQLDTILNTRNTVWPEQLPSLTEWRRQYCQGFVLPPKERLVPVESIYRQWTYDESCSLPIAKEKGHLMSDAALHMQRLYVEFGIEVPPELKQQPDHLLLELEFMGLLVEQGDLERQRIFLKEHLDWVAELCEDAQVRGISIYYLQVLQLIREWLAAERERCDYAAQEM